MPSAGRVRATHLHFQVRQPLGDLGLDLGANLLLDAEENLPIVERTGRQRNDEREREAPFEEEPAEVDRALDNGADPFGNSWCDSVQTTISVVFKLSSPQLRRLRPRHCRARTRPKHPAASTIKASMAGSR